MNLITGDSYLGERVYAMIVHYPLPHQETRREEDINQDERKKSPEKDLRIKKEETLKYLPMKVTGIAILRHLFTRREVSARGSWIWMANLLAMEVSMTESSILMNIKASPAQLPRKRVGKKAAQFALWITKKQLSCGSWPAPTASTKSASTLGFFSRTIHAPYAGPRPICGPQLP